LGCDTEEAGRHYVLALQTIHIALSRNHYLSEIVRIATISNLHLSRKNSGGKTTQRFDQRTKTQHPFIDNVSVEPLRSDVCMNGGRT
jgi:hypothetical protein